MKKMLLSALVVILPAVLWGKDKTPVPAGACVAVEPGGDPCRYTWSFHKGELMPHCFSYVESENLPLSLVKTFYIEKDLNSLQERGLKVVVTSKESIRANPDSGCHQSKH